VECVSSRETEYGSLSDDGTCNQWSAGFLEKEVPCRATPHFGTRPHFLGNSQRGGCK